MQHTPQSRRWKRPSIDWKSLNNRSKYIYYVLRDGSCHKKAIYIYRERGGGYRFWSVRVATTLKYIADMSCFIKYLLYDLCIDIYYLYTCVRVVIRTTNTLCFICQDEWEDQLEYAIAFHLIGAHRRRVFFSSCLKGFTGMVRELV